MFSCRKTRQAMYIKRNIEARSRNHCCRGKATRTTYNECVSVALVIQHANAHASLLYCHLWSVWLHHIFPHYLINGMTFGGRGGGGGRAKKVIEHKMCVLIFSTNSAWKKFLIIKRIQRDIIINFYWSSFKYPFLLSNYNLILFWQNFEK